MARECAFCPQTANLSLEHLWSSWMNALFPGKKRFTTKNEKGEIVKQWLSSSLDWKARVVCRQCNNTWMSDLESQHAQPAMTDLIVGKLDFTISQSQSRSLALFAFKTAVIFDHIQGGKPPFFLRSLRHRFASTLAIPFGVGMWMTGFLPIGKGEILTTYHEGALSNTNRLKLYVCTYAVGHLVFQVVAARQQGFTPIAPRPGFEYLAIPFWPKLPSGVRWPPDEVLRTVSEFEIFATRWNTIMVKKGVGGSTF
jgi:hypothetical protein